MWCSLLLITKMAWSESLIQNHGALISTLWFYIGMIKRLMFWILILIWLLFGFRYTIYQSAFEQGLQLKKFVVLLVCWTRTQRRGKLQAMVLFMYGLRWTFQNLYAEAECFLWRMVRNFGSLSNISSCQTCVIGAIASYMTTETVSCGLRMVAHYHLRLNNMVHGSEQHLSCDKKETQFLFLVFIKLNPLVQLQLPPQSCLQNHKR